MWSICWHFTGLAKQITFNNLQFLIWQKWICQLFHCWSYLRVHCWGGGGKKATVSRSTFSPWTPWTFSPSLSTRIRSSLEAFIQMCSLGSSSIWKMEEENLPRIILHFFPLFPFCPPSTGGCFNKGSSELLTGSLERALVRKACLSHCDLSKQRETVTLSSFVGW